MRKLALLASIAAALLAPSAAQAAGTVSVGHSAWSWGNPQPQGNTLGAIDFAGGTGYAAGAFGTLVKTTDNGFTWSGVATGVKADFTQLRVLDAANLVVGGGCVMRRSQDGGDTFTRILATASERSCPAPIRSFYFVNPQTGYVLFSDGSIERTDDGGQTFQRKTPVTRTAAAGGAPAQPAGDLWFTGADTGYATSGGSIYKTSDGGAVWTAVYAGGQRLSGFYFVDNTTGYAVGDSKTVLKTTDTGSNWAPQTTPGGAPPADLTRIRCAGAQRCLAASRQGDQLLRTDNGGATWASVVPAGSKVFAAAFNTVNAAAAVGEAGATVISANGGANWAPVGSALIGRLTRLRATSSQTVFATGQNGSLARTTNGGDDWTTPGVATTQNIVDVAFPTYGVGYAVDAAGVLYRSSDAGAHWGPVNTGGRKATGVVATDPNTVIVLGPKGLLRSLHGGDFAPVQQKLVRASAFTDYARTTTGLFFYGPKVLVATDLTGASFKAVPLPGPGLRIQDCYFVTSGIGFALTTDGRLWATRNGGKTWAERRATGTSAGLDMAWGDARNGYLSVKSFGGDSKAGYLLRTSDGGQSWRPQLVAPAPIRDGGLVATAANTAFALADGNMLFHTASGGDQGKQSLLRISTNVARVGARGRVVTISGRLTPAVAGADVYVSFRNANGGTWVTRLAAPTTKAGRFTVRRRLTRPTLVVAQWLGDADRNGSGSNLLSLGR